MRVKPSAARKARRSKPWRSLLAISPSAVVSAPAFASRRWAAAACGLSVFRSAKNIYAQVIDDVQRRRGAAASSLEGGKDGGKGSDKAAAERVGKLVAERALEKGVKDVVFDRGGLACITAASRPSPTPRAKPA